jgi:hypothetical protein
LKILRLFLVRLNKYFGKGDCAHWEILQRERIRCSVLVIIVAIKPPNSWDLCTPRQSSRRSWVWMKRLGRWMVVRLKAQTSLRRRRDLRTLSLQCRQTS